MQMLVLDRSKGLLTVSIESRSNSDDALLQVFMEHAGLMVDTVSCDDPLIS